MIFLDTSGVYALADTDDENHEEAERMFESAQRTNEQIMTHNYVLVESAALLHRRLGLKVALAFLEDAKAFELVWVDEDLHSNAVEYLKQLSSNQVSLVDALSLLIMRDKQVDTYLGFDKHFSNVGFTRYVPS